MPKSSARLVKIPVLVALCATAASLVGWGHPPQAARQEVGPLVREGEEQIRQQVLEYEQRLAQIDFARANHPATYKGASETINNNYNVHYRAILRIANESDARISRLRGASPEAKRHAIETINTSRATHIKVLQGRRRAALERLNRERTRRPAR